MLALLLAWLLSPGPAFAASLPPESRLTLYTYPSSGFVDFTTPASLFRTFFELAGKAALQGNNAVPVESDFADKGHLSSRYISRMGHTIAHIQCQKSDGAWYDHWAAMNGAVFTSVGIDLFFKQKLGYGFPFYPNIDGIVVTGDENWKELVYYKGAKVNGPDGKISRQHPRYIAFQIDAEACDKISEMVSFFESFHYYEGTKLADLQAQDPENVLYFSAIIDPLKSYQERLTTGHGKVGGDCAAFAAALVSLAGQFDPIFEKLWRRTLTISENLIGGIPIGDTNQIRRVSLYQLLFTDLGRHWTYEGVPNRTLNSYDPAHIWNFIGEVMTCLSSPDGKSCTPDVREWMDRHHQSLSLGATQTFSDDSAKHWSCASLLGRAAQVTSQDIEGIVIAR